MNFLRSVGFLLIATGVSCSLLEYSDISDDRELFCKYKPDGVYQDPYDGCVGFIHCNNYVSSYKLCPGKLLFNVKENICDRPENVDCPMGILDCDVGIIGGGISGLYMAYELLKKSKETKVCLFEKDTRLGGRILDYRFKQAPNIDVGLGAWRIDKKHNVMIDLLSELEIQDTEWSFVEPSLIESRGIIAKNHEKIKKGYTYLRNHPKFGKMSSSELLSYASKPEHVATASNFSTVNTYFTNYITHEGSKYLSELYGYKGDYTEFINPSSYMEFTEMSLKLDDKYIRPIGGMSTIINTLRDRVESLGGKIYTSIGVNTLEKEGSLYTLLTPHLKVRAKKLVVAVPPMQFGRINGTIAKKIQHTAEFQSIQPIPAFKGAAVFDKAWWEDVNVAGTTIKPGQKYISNSNCLGITMVHRGKGFNGAGVMHTMYSDGACGRRWADVANLKKNFLDIEVKRALEQKFRTKIPKPLTSVYQFWESAWHFQKPGTPFTMAGISDWAKRPFAGDDIFVVGEAFHPYRGWCEGAIVSSKNALLEGWGIQTGIKTAFQDTNVKNEDISETIRYKPIARA